MEYTQTTEADRYRMLAARLHEYERRHFDQTMQRKVNEAAGVDNTEVDRQIAELEVAAAVVAKELDGMPVPEVPPSRRDEAIARRRPRP